MTESRESPESREPPPARLPPDPEAYDSVRAQHARARGLAAPYIAGGRDPDPDAGRREERFYGRLLVIMVLVVVFGGFVVGVILALLQSGGS
ncbi:MAG: hypothetical protein WEE50_07025 [Chloroflexota bacterium]